MENTKININIDNNICLSFAFSDNAYCCGQYKIGNINIYTVSGEQIINKYPNWQEFINSIIGDNYSDTKTSIICTVIDGPVYDILIQLGFKVLSKFKNCKTGNTVTNLEYIIEHGYIYEDNDIEDDSE